MSGRHDEQVPLEGNTVGASPAARGKGVVAAARRVVGAWTKRGYPEDERTRKRTTVVGLLATALGMISWQMWDASAARKEAKAANDTALQLVSAMAEENRQDVRDMIKATSEMATEVRGLAQEVRADRGAYNRPTPYRLRVKPAPRELPVPAGGVKPPP